MPHSHLISVTVLFSGISLLIQTLVILTSTRFVQLSFTHHNLHFLFLNFHVISRTHSSPNKRPNNCKEFKNVLQLVTQHSTPTFTWTPHQTVSHQGVLGSPSSTPMFPQVGCEKLVWISNVWPPFRESEHIFGDSSTYLCVCSLFDCVDIVLNISKEFWENHWS